MSQNNRTIVPQEKDGHLRYLYYKNCIRASELLQIDRDPFSMNFWNGYRQGIEKFYKGVPQGRCWLLSLKIKLLLATWSASYIFKCAGIIEGLRGQNAARAIVNYRWYQALLWK